MNSDRVMRERLGRRSPWEYKQAIFKFEYKLFRVQTSQGGSMVTITEEIRNNKFQISIDREGAGWLVEKLRGARREFTNVNFFGKYHMSNVLFTLQRHQNKNGVFMNLLKIVKGVVQRIVVIPAGENGTGWTGIAEAVESIVATKDRINANHRDVFMEKQKIVPQDNRGLTNQSYADVVKKQKVSDRQETNVDWKRMFVCTRDSLWNKWAHIEREINRQLDTEIRLQPFQPDKAYFKCRDEEEIAKFSRKGVLFMEGNSAISIQNWSRCNVLYNRKEACSGGWIEILDLPLNWWNVEVFNKIGAACGGLLSIDGNTKERGGFFAPRIMVKGNYNGFIPTEVDLAFNDEIFTVRLRVRSKLRTADQRRKGGSSDLCVFDRCVVKLNGRAGNI